MSLALVLVGQLASPMFHAAATTTRWFAADLANLGHGGDENRLGGGDAFETAGKHAPNVAGMAADAHSEPSFLVFLINTGNKSKRKGAKKRQSRQNARFAEAIVVS
jgi:hypothetical protein